MKKLILVLLLSPLFVTVCHAENLYGQVADLSGAQELEDALPQEAGEISGQLVFNGFYDANGALKRLWASMLAELKRQISENMSCGIQLLAVVMLCAVLTALMDAGKYAEILETAACCVVSLLMARTVDSMVGQAVEALGRLSDYSRAAMPVLFTAAAFGGAVASASARYASVSLAMDVMISFQQRYLLPLIYAFLAVSISKGVFSNSILSAVSGFIKWCITMGMTAVTLLFSAYISITGIVAGSTDAVAVKTARTVISSMLPVVGGILSDSASVLLASAAAVKNAAGVFSLIAVCALCAGPFVVLSVRMLFFKAAAAVAEMLPVNRVSRLIGDFGTCFGMLLGLVGSYGIMLFLSIMSGIKAVTL